MDKPKVQPDWSHTGISGNQIAAFVDPTRKFEFAGPGFYLTDTDTLLIIPRVKAETHSWWRAKQPADMMYDIYCWNVTVEQTIFGSVGLIPTRKDDRE